MDTNHILPTKKTEKPVAEHFNHLRHSLEHMRVMVIDVLKANDDIHCKIKEGKWIITLDTCFPRGMNLRNNSL